MGEELNGHVNCGGQEKSPDKTRYNDEYLMGMMGAVIIMMSIS